MKFDLYIFLYCDCGQPKLFCLAPPLIGAVIMAKLYIDCSKIYQGATYGHNEEHIFSKIVNMIYQILMMNSMTIHLYRQGFI
jgi:hypothetical protein